jgi:hypothetical protein
MKPTNVGEFIGELDAGLFDEKVSEILSVVAASVMDVSEYKNGASGKVAIELEISRIGSSFQVNVAHNLKYTVPTQYGKKTEENKKSTPMHVGKGGRMTFFPEDQTQLFSKTGEPNT